MDLLPTASRSVIASAMKAAIATKPRKRGDSLVVARRNASKMLDLVDEALDEMTFLYRYLSLRHVC
jgi:hypothetical protein